MSSDVMTQPTWKRLHVARRVSDIAKSMIRLSRLGRSIFPISNPLGAPADKSNLEDKASGNQMAFRGPLRTYFFPRNLASTDGSQDGCHGPDSADVAPGARLPHGAAP